MHSTNPMIRHFCVSEGFYTGSPKWQTRMDQCGLLSHYVVTTHLKYLVVQRHQNLYLILLRRAIRLDGESLGTWEMVAKAETGRILESERWMDDDHDCCRGVVDGCCAETGQHKKISYAIMMQALNSGVNWRNWDINPHIRDKSPPMMAGGLGKKSRKRMPQGRKR